MGIGCSPPGAVSFFSEGPGAPLREDPLLSGLLCGRSFAGLPLPYGAQQTPADTHSLFAGVPQTRMPFEHAAQSFSDGLRTHDELPLSRLVDNLGSAISEREKSREELLAMPYVTW